VFQAGWAGVPAEWRQVSEADAAMWRAVLNIRSEINLLLEKARADKALGASLEAKVRLLCSSAF
jgi:isoleucyl-tRNA synthetase